MSEELWRMSAVEAVARLGKGEISPLELIDASARRIVVLLAGLAGDTAPT